MLVIAIKDWNRTQKKCTSTDKLLLPNSVSWKDTIWPTDCFIRMLVCSIRVSRPISISVAGRANATST